jgi:hypothetical protein
MKRLSSLRQLAVARQWATTTPPSDVFLSSCAIVQVVITRSPVMLDKPL